MSGSERSSWEKIMINKRNKIRNKWSIRKIKKKKTGNIIILQGNAILIIDKFDQNNKNWAIINPILHGGKVGANVPQFF